jgi:iduronate 2-sulfatase
LRNYRDLPKQGRLSDDLQRTLIHGYYAAASYMDAQAGRVLDELQRLGLRDNTIVVLWGDHGWHLGDHGMWCKHTNYEQAARIPLIVSMPGAKAGVSSAAFIEAVDVYPTLSELAGLPQPTGLDGRSFAKLLSDPASQHRDHVIHVYPRTAEGRGSLLGRAIRTERYRLVEWKPAGGAAAEAEYELYDYAADPQESVNLAGTQPETVRALQMLLAGHPEARPQVRAGDSGQPSAANGKQDRDAMFARRDRDGDGKLSRAEFLEGQSDPAKAPGRFVKFDVNKDGVLSRNEFVTSGGRE